MSSNNGHSDNSMKGLPADVCPYCGCAMFVNGTQSLRTLTYRYVVCRNPNCRKKFYTKQSNPEIVREITKTDKDSSYGTEQLTRYRATA